MDLGTDVPDILEAHPLVDSVVLTGSRAVGGAHELSDWDFAVETPGFDELAEQLPGLVAPLHALAAQWDRYSSHACYMLLLRGPVKVDLLFLEEEQEWAPAWEASRETLAPIDRHFWDWILWLEQKRRGGKHEAVSASLGDMYELMLRPLGVKSRPGSVVEALGLYLARRDALAKRFGVELPDELEREVRSVIEPQP